ncbi:MAG: thioredoxin family protein [bacterium]|nr:thioredoxin family protein [bacterium]
MSRHIARVALFLMLCVPGIAAAQMFDPVKWAMTLTMSDDGKTATAEMTARIDRGWHVYSHLVNPEAGPTPLTVTWSDVKGAKQRGNLTSQPAPTVKYDDMFGAELSWWASKVTLRQAFDVIGPAVTLKGTLRYQTCDDSNCLPPAKEPIELHAKVAGSTVTPVEAPRESADSATVAVTDTLPAKIAPMATDSAATSPVGVGGALWAPVTFSESNAADSYESTSLWWIFFTCFLGGFLALLTPCVWPMIPLTVSFFLKKSDTRGSGIGRAVTYGLSIVVIYVLLGMVVTLLFGASSLNALSTSAVCNIIFFLLLLVFAVSFFGTFDIKLPSKFINKMDARAESTTGLLGIFFMAFTLTLVSFSCTGPIIGTLLVEAATSGDKFGPAIGMLGFSLALAIPFALFALFPSWLKSAPRSGCWMDTVKVVLGFIELALSLKFLSVADLAYGWHLLDREAFLCLWIVIFGLLGVYLLGGFSFSHYGPKPQGIGVGRFFCALVSLAFTFYLVPGLWGAPLKGVSAFVPPLYTQDFNLYGEGFKEYHDYDEGMAAAQAAGRPALVDFSGYGCVNCRKMEGAVLDLPEIKTMIEERFTVIKLMVDEKKALPQPVVVTERGREMSLDSYGELWSYLQRTKFGANAQPYYVILDPSTGALLSGPYSYDENAARFTRFLEKGLAAR